MQVFLLNICTHLSARSDKGALVIVRVENPEKALEVLKDENVTVVSPEEVYRM